MPQYNGRDIKELSYKELVDASFALETMLSKALERRNHPKYRGKFKNQPPPEINPAFSELRNQIKAEIDKRIKEKENET